MKLPPQNHPCNLWVGKSFESVKPLDKLNGLGGVLKALTLCFFILVASVPAVAGKRRPAQSATSAASSAANENSIRAKILAMEEQRTADMQLLHWLNHPSSRVRKAAILALGRIADPSTLGDLAGLMNKRRYGEKATVAFALGLFPDEVATTVLVQHLAMQKDSSVVREIFLGLGRQGSEKHLQAVTKPILQGASITILDAACLALGMLWSKPSEDWPTPEGVLPALSRAVASRQALGTSCAFAASRFKGPESEIPVKDFIVAANQNGSPQVKAYVARLLGRSKTTEASDALLLWASAADRSLRIEALKALATQPFVEREKDVVFKSLKDPRTSVQVQALIVVATHGSKLGDFAGALNTIYTKNPSLWVRGYALKALAEVDLPTAKTKMDEVLKNGPAALVPAAVSVLAAAPKPEDWPRIAAFIQQDSPKIVVEMLDALSLRFDGEWPPEWRAALKKSLERADPAICSAASQVVSRYQWKEFAPTLATALTKLTQADQVEPKIALLSALGAVGNSSQSPLLQTALNDPQKAVAQAAVDALKAITGQDFSQRIPPNSRFPTSSFQWDEIDRASRAEVVLKTTRGEIVLRMNGQAPVTALQFTRLVKKKFYDGLLFHRVVPNFVAQGGDPRGDGYGGSGYLLRDEFAPATQLRATAGIATSGRDTGGSQFYINLSANRHLDGRYTLFANVIGGIDVADRLEEGDRIIQARVR
jgi:cyclophilin family peptidyl-prolyl cis-trans isomerase/HEAT repeat protein